MKRIFELTIPLWDGSQVTAKKTSFVAMSSQDACNRSTLQTHSVPRCMDFVQRGRRRDGNFHVLHITDYCSASVSRLPDSAHFAHPIGYLLSKTVVGLQEPWIRAKFAADAPQYIDKAFKSNEIGLKAKIKELQEWNMKQLEMGSLLTETTGHQPASVSTLIDMTERLKESEDEYYGQSLEDRATIKEREEKIEDLEAEIKRLRRQQAALASHNEKETRSQRMPLRSAFSEDPRLDSVVRYLHSLKPLGRA